VNSNNQVTTPVLEGDDFSLLFPRSRVVSAFKQAYSWTAVSSVVMAAQMLEGRLADGIHCIDLGIPGDKRLQKVFAYSLSCMFDAFHCAQPKLVLAKCLDTKIRTETQDQLMNADFRPDIRQCLSHTGDEDYLNYKIKDSPHKVAIAIGPLLMVNQLLVEVWWEAQKWNEMDRQSKAPDGTSRVVHMPRTFSSLVATLDALVYFSLGFKVGIQWNALGNKTTVDMGYYCVNMIGQPPFSTQDVMSSRELYKILVGKGEQP